MKKLILAFGIFISANALNAQTFSIGPSVGFGHSWLSENLTVPAGTTTVKGDKQFNESYNAGISLAYSTKESWGFGMDIKYAREGGKYEFDVSGTKYELDAQVNYLRIPLRATYYLREWGDGIRPKVSLGPNLGFLLNAENEVKGNGTTNTNDIKDDIKSFDFGMQGALGCNFRLASNTWLNTDVVYNHGFTKINKNDASALGAGDIKNRNIGLNVGVLFGLGGGSDIETASKPRNL